MPMLEVFGTAQWQLEQLRWWWQSPSFVLSSTRQSGWSSHAFLKVVRYSCIRVCGPTVLNARARWQKISFSEETCRNRLQVSGSKDADRRSLLVLTSRVSLGYSRPHHRHVCDRLTEPGRYWTGTRCGTNVVAVSIYTRRKASYGTQERAQMNSPSQKDRMVAHEPDLDSRELPIGLARWLRLLAPGIISGSLGIPCASYAVNDPRALAVR